MVLPRIEVVVSKQGAAVANIEVLDALQKAVAVAESNAVKCVALADDYGAYIPHLTYYAVTNFSDSKVARKEILRMLADYVGYTYKESGKPLCEVVAEFLEHLYPNKEVFTMTDDNGVVLGYGLRDKEIPF